jgi:threonylcarbamoyladenosine tRNA methylthiotransferase CDKAL1
MNMKFYIETFGCTSNVGNSQDAARALQEMGHVPSTHEEADMVIVNTCAVTEKTERKILQRLRLLQGDRLVVAGCLSAALPGSIGEISRRGMVGPLNKDAAIKIAGLFSVSESGGTGNIASKSISQKSANSPADDDAGKDARKDSGKNSCKDLCGIINIAEGCNGGCSYCIVRMARGRLKSKSLQEIIDEARMLLDSGVVEIQLAAQDTASYGNDCELSLPALLKELCSLPGDFMLRVGMMNPDTLQQHLAETIDAMRSPKVYRFLHIPIQSGSDRILGRMGRRYTSEDFAKITGELRSDLPGLSLNTDAIVGFPGEAAEDFQKTLDLVRQVQPDKVNITKFSPRPGTPAARLYDIPDRIKKDRSRVLTRLWLQIAAKNNERLVGRTLQALVTERGRNGTMKARAANYLGIVVYGNPVPGSSIRVKITASNSYYLTGWADLV